MIRNNTLGTIKETNTISISKENKKNKFSIELKLLKEQHKDMKKDKN